MLGAALVMSGCSHMTADGPRSSEPVPTTSTPHPSVSKESQQLYVIGEVAYEDGRFEDAVALFRQALLALPQTEAADDLRHALVLRVAHTQLLAWNTTGRLAHLTDARSMLERYVVVHEQLVGNGEHAQAQRGEVYELLYEVESALEPEADPDEEAAVDHGSKNPAASDDGESPPDDHAGESLTPEMVRKIRVRDTRLASLDDPRVEQRLRSSFSDPVAGLVLTNGVDGLIHGPRPLVRIMGARVSDDVGSNDRRLARKAALSAVRAARVDLRDCYRRAYARKPEDVAQTRLSIEVRPDGHVADAQVFEGLDTIGNACVATRIAEQAVDEPPSLAVRVVVPLTFFYEGAKRLESSIGGKTGAEPSRQRTQPFEMPAIDEFAKPDPSSMIRQ